MNERLHRFFLIVVGGKDELQFDAIPLKEKKTCSHSNLNNVKDIFREKVAIVSRFRFAPDFQISFMLMSIVMKIF